ncbi:hypothetical protein BMB171_C3662 [Bacillus thuringiensis BMB171]|nr:hypothetical protein BMB171_C3662 [Bacillus thuringiensis BMB171]
MAHCKQMKLLCVNDKKEPVQKVPFLVKVVFFEYFLLLHSFFSYIVIFVAKV